MNFLPDFLILGAQRAGTSSLWFYLAEHPNVIPATKTVSRVIDREAGIKEVDFLGVKELGFFTLRMDKGIEWYRKWFRIGSMARTGLCFEATTDYLYNPKVPKRVKEFLPECKFIVLLRNPVDRAYSHYWLERRYTRKERLSFEDALERVDDGSEKYLRHYTYLEQGDYLPQIKRWLKYFSKDRFFFIKTESFLEYPRDIFLRVLDFLGLTLIDLPKYKLFNTRKYPSMDIETRDRLEEYFKPKNEALGEFFGTGSWWPRKNDSI